MLKADWGSGTHLTHEHLTTEDTASGPSDRSFGWVFTIFFCLAGAWPMLYHEPARRWALVISAVFALVTLLRPALLHPANRLWTRFGLLLGKLTNPIVTGLLFFLVVTPIGLLLRLAGKDLLRLRRDPDASSYWIERRPPGPPPESMPQQF